MDPTECLIFILLGIIFWYFAILSEAKYGFQRICNILCVCGIMVSFFGFMELIHYDELNDLQISFAMLMGILYTVLVVYAIGNYVETRQDKLYLERHKEMTNAQYRDVVNKLSIQTGKSEIEVVRTLEQLFKPKQKESKIKDILE